MLFNFFLTSFVSLLHRDHFVSVLAVRIVLVLRKTFSANGHVVYTQRRHFLHGKRDYRKFYLGILI